MTADTPSPRAGATPLWRDLRVLNIAAQVIVVAVVGVVAAFMVSNMLTAMNERGLGFGFSFLSRQAGFENWRVARAATKVSGQPVPKLTFVEGRALFEQPRHRHNEAGRAEPALRSVAVDHRPLHYVGYCFRAQAFDRDDVCRFQLKHELDARIDGSIHEPAAILG